MAQGIKNIMGRQLILDRIEVDASTGCWIWRGTVNHEGYGIISVDMQPLRAHRLAHELFVGPIIPTDVICHTCDNPTCVSPAHLYIGTHKQNALDRVSRGRNHNSKGQFNSQAKLTPQMVRLIRVDNRIHRLIAADYGVTRKAISMIKDGTRWRHIT